MIAWWTRRSIATGRGHRVLKDLVPLGEDEVGSDDDTLALVALGQEGKQDLHLLAVLLHVADVIEDDGVEMVEPFEYGFELELPLGDEGASGPA